VSWNSGCEPACGFTNTAHASRETLHCATRHSTVTVPEHSWIGVRTGAIDRAASNRLSTSRKAERFWKADIHRLSILDRCSRRDRRPEHFPSSGSVRAHHGLQLKIKILARAAQQTSLKASYRAGFCPQTSESSTWFSDECLASEACLRPPAVAAVPQLRPERFSSFLMAV